MDVDPVETNKYLVRLLVEILNLELMPCFVSGVGSQDSHLIHGGSPVALDHLIEEIGIGLRLKPVVRVDRLSGFDVDNRMSAIDATPDVQCSRNTSSHAVDQLLDTVGKAKGTSPILFGSIVARADMIGKAANGEGRARTWRPGIGTEKSRG